MKTRILVLIVALSLIDSTAFAASLKLEQPRSGVSPVNVGHLAGAIPFDIDWTDPTSVPSRYIGSKVGLDGWPIPFMHVQSTSPLPSNASKEALLNAYRVYAIVKYCNSIRKGYLVTYVNDIELGRAREKIKLIEAPYIAESNNLDVRRLYDAAAGSTSGYPINGQVCQFVLRQLLSDWYTPGVSEELKKDF